MRALVIGVAMMGAALAGPATAAADSPITPKDCLKYALQYAVDRKNASLGLSATDSSDEIQARSVLCRARGYWAEINTDLPRDEYTKLIDFQIAILTQDLEEIIAASAKARAGAQ